MVKLENKIRELEKQQVTILATPLPEESMKQDLQNLRDEIKQLGREIRTQLKAIEPQKEEADENSNSVNTRMRKTQHGVLSQQFVELINKCNLMQSEYREKNVERIRRQLKITNAGMVSDEELEQMLDSGQSEVFVSNILKDTQVTRQALNEISARHSEIQQLERSIRELHEIFTFLATEVEMQGEMINRIEKNILSSADYVERGQEHVKKALENQKKARKLSSLASPQQLDNVAHSRYGEYQGLGPGLLSQSCGGRAESPAGPLSGHWPLRKGADGSFRIDSCLFGGPPPSGHDAWGRACSVLFDWDTWFCKKIKKSWRPLCMCVPRRIGPGLPLSSFPPPVHSWGQAQSDRLRSECPRCCDHSGLALSFCSPTKWVECVGKRFCLAPSSYCAPTVSTYT
ncbi:syntaxin 4, transcript variant X3 [Ictidomys tridecemlineatus]|nr:syntaxin-4 isoform X2 [Ictidomys tridecemlineatus]XP_040133405.1 syntaxin-4 isoform X2 [Ictidomys tridecemlineatus]XP_040133406.1 syntaxin-4 isoform X2 [Ictidomys tridecemlineatus]XP_040133407.1 syntaxin-4 isoform X2 [Ictidomys tridecemlineatus]KAG3259676.1 syntaxin 4, transcript variant X3 [Ictidomys tridecemlineatus]